MSPEHIACDLCVGVVRPGPNPGTILVAHDACARHGAGGPSVEDYDAAGLPCREDSDALFMDGSDGSLRGSGHDGYCITVGFVKGGRIGVLLDLAAGRMQFFRNVPATVKGSSGQCPSRGTVGGKGGWPDR